MWHCLLWPQPRSRVKSCNQEDHFNSGQEAGFSSPSCSTLATCSTISSQSLVAVIVPSVIAIFIESSLMAVTASSSESSNLLVRHSLSSSVLALMAPMPSEPRQTSSIGFPSTNLKEIVAPPHWNAILSTAFKGCPTRFSRVDRLCITIFMPNFEVHTSATGSAPPIQVEICRYPPAPTRNG